MKDERNKIDVGYVARMGVRLAYIRMTRNVGEEFFLVVRVQSNGDDNGERRR